MYYIQKITIFANSNYCTKLGILCSPESLKRLEKLLI